MLNNKWFVPSPHLNTNKEKYNYTIRALALYSMVDESSGVRESGPTRKKNWQFLRHALKLLLKHVVLQVKNMLKIPKIDQIQEFSIFIFFFSPIWTCQHILFFIFFFPASQKIPCRNPSTIEYNACALIFEWLEKNSFKIFLRKWKSYHFKQNHGHFICHHI